MAASITIRYFGDASALRSLPALTRDIQRRGRNVETAAKRLCPVDTGRLRSSIRTRMENRSTGPVAIVESNVVYAKPVNDGHRIVRRGVTYGFVKGRFFLERALPAAAK